MMVHFQTLVCDGEITLTWEQFVQLALAFCNAHINIYIYIYGLGTLSQEYLVYANIEHVHLLKCLVASF